jgi:hypothetical protein
LTKNKTRNKNGDILVPRHFYLRSKLGQEPAEVEAELCEVKSIHIAVAVVIESRLIFRLANQRAERLPEKRVRLSSWTRREIGRWDGLASRRSASNVPKSVSAERMMRPPVAARSNNVGSSAAANP